ncbi:hypothetical protein Kisp02_22620 [Kineosporia sp. NBRC 101731]|nr:hypothetical protein Kisp02_22620 [Kineosporia sp. NBRC 101731]
MWRLAAKLGHYQNLLAEGLAPSWPLLIVVLTARREQHLHAYLNRTVTQSNGSYAQPYGRISRQNRSVGPDRFCSGQGSFKHELLVGSPGGVRRAGGRGSCRSRKCR